MKRIVGVSEKGYFPKTKDEIFDYGVNEIPNIKESGGV